MARPDSVQLKLRRAFRYGYYAFLGGIVMVLALLILWAANGDLSADLARAIPDSSLLMMIALVAGFCVPLFFAGWLLIGNAFMGPGTNRSSFTTDLAD